MSDKKEMEQMIDDKSVVSGEKRSTKATVLIVLFAIVLSALISSELSLVVQRILDIPAESIGLARWGDAFILRIIASLASIAAGAFVVGTFLNVEKRARIAGAISAVPASLFWLAIWILSVVVGSDYGLAFESAKHAIILPSVLVVLLPIVGYYSASWGYEYHNDYKRPKSILNIKWYHWLWLLPFYVAKVVPVLVYSLISLIKFDFGGHAPATIFPTIFSFIGNLGYYLGRMVLLFAIIGLFMSVSHAYGLLIEESKTTKEKWKKAGMLFGHVILFGVAYSLVFGEYI